MSIDTNEIRALSAVEKIRLVELIWDDLGEATTPIPLPDWIDQETTRRRNEMRDGLIGLSHEEMWRRIEQRDA